MNLLYIIYIYFNNIEVLYSVSIKYWQLNADYNILQCIGPKKIVSRKNCQKLQYIKCKEVSTMYKYLMKPQPKDRVN